MSSEQPQRQLLSRGREQHPRPAAPHGGGGLAPGQAGGRGPAEADSLTGQAPARGSLLALFPLIPRRLAAPAHRRVLSAPGGLPVTAGPFTRPAAYLRGPGTPASQLGSTAAPPGRKCSGRADGRRAVHTARPRPDPWSDPAAAHHTIRCHFPVPL